MPTWIVFLVILSVLVLVHEAGHFIAARILGIKVEEFAFGLPFTRPIVKIKRGETQYAVYPLLFGGFVRLFGEETEPESGGAKERRRSFWVRGRKQRMAVVGAGVVMNVLLAMAGFVLLYSAVGIPAGKAGKVTIVNVAEGSPAQTAGILPDDRVVKVEDRQITTNEEFIDLMRSWAGLGVNITLERGPGIPLFEGIAEQEVEQRVVNAVPRANPPAGQGALGVAITDEPLPYLQMEKCPVWNNPGCLARAVAAGVEATGVWAGRVVDGLRQIGRSLAAKKVPEGVAGPVGIYQITGLVSQAGVWPTVELVSILSVNLAVFNVLPIPALDGGRMLFIWVEWLRRKRLPAGLEQRINSWGMAILIGLLILISLQDVIRLGMGKM